MLWKTLKVFVSSTFKDLELARDQLAHIFHRMEKDLIKRQLVLRLYDLRWRDRHSNEPLVDWCLNMVDQCQYFVGILGHRYGWRPPLGFKGEKNKENRSITEMETRYALKKIDRKCRFFCISKQPFPSNLSRDDQASLKNLQKYLEDSGEDIYFYSNVKEMWFLVLFTAKKIKLFLVVGMPKYTRYK